MKKKPIKKETINCAEAVSRFNDFIDNYIESRFREELVEHISNCRHCFERLEFEQEIKGKVHQLMQKRGDAKLAKRIENLIATL